MALIYEETFSPISNKEPFRIITTLVAYYDSELDQMDVKVIFLNENLEEEIYMNQPGDFQLKKGSHGV